jgi:hypothetical protein
MTNRLLKLLGPMELPEWRKTKLTIHNCRWLLHNMGLKNATHPNFEEAKTLLVNIVRNGLVKEEE